MANGIQTIGLPPQTITPRAGGAGAGAAGAAGGPVGAAIGAGVGVLGGILGGLAARKKEARERAERERARGLEFQTRGAQATATGQAQGIQNIVGAIQRGLGA